MARRLSAYAREPAGISSAAMIASSRLEAAHAPRLTVCVAASSASEGARAPSTVETTQVSSDSVRISRRPRRSAAAPKTMARSPPIRTAASAFPCAAVPAPNSSAANVIVCVSRVPW